MRLPDDWVKYHEEKIASLDPEKVERAVEHLAGQLLTEEARRLLPEMTADPQSWWVKYHFNACMAVRNALREEGMGEKYFGVDTLDDYYVPMLERAIRKSALTQESPTATEP
jgi:hypothetical protein